MPQNTTSEQELSLIRDLPGGVMAYAATGTQTLTYANEKALSLFRCKNIDELLSLNGGTYSHRVCEEDRDEVARETTEQIRINGNAYENVCYRIQAAGGSVVDVVESGTLVFDQAGNPESYVLLISPSRENAREQLSDSLTGLMNMKAFLEAVDERRLIDHCGHCIIFFNLTDFKSYNLYYGTTAGDNLLKDVAQAICDAFPHCLIARFADDHFAVYCVLENPEERIEWVDAKFSHGTGYETIRIKGGIRKIEEFDATIPTSALCDQARTACDEVSAIGNMLWMKYEEAFDEDHELQSYIVNNIDRAIEQGWLRAVLQPVIRTLTGKLCGFEALSRWEDPVHGSIPPSMLIPVLEKSRVVTKVDRFIIEQACMITRRRLDKYGMAVPISFNLSPISFASSNPFEVISRISAKYNVPHEYLRVEITESMYMADKERVKSQVDKLREAGFEVWMDDFGSGYSSLNVLKDLPFDEIKLDMLFVRNLDEKARELITAIVSAATHIGIKTLAEGVETEEQIAFLKSIGCDKIQGYYYGTPMSAERIRQHMRDFGIAEESRAEEKLIDEAGKVDMTSGLPLAIIKDDGMQLRILNANEAYRNALKTLGTADLETANSNLDSPTYTLASRFRQIANSISLSGKEQTVVYADRGHYVRLVCKNISQIERLKIHQASISIIQQNTDEMQAARYHAVLEELLPVYDSVNLFNMRENTQETLFSNDDFEPIGETLPNATSRFEQYAERYIHEDDKARFKEFCDYDSMLVRIRSLGRGFVTESFRFRQPDATYIWKDVTVVSSTHNPGVEFLVFTKDSAFKHSRDPIGLIRSMLSDFDDETPLTVSGEEWGKDGELWRNLMANSQTMYFWKDAQRRFMGANKAFVEYHGLDSIDDVLGKTSEEAGLVREVDKPEFLSQELEVIEQGKTLHNYPAIVIHSNSPHKIHATKMPIYRSGQIIGLIGYFIDADEAESGDESRIILDREKFDLMNDRVYMADLDTHEILYMNERVRKGLGLPEDFSLEGKKCHELFSNLARPCDMCTNPLLSRDCVVETIRHNPISHKDYLMRDTLVMWKGKACRLSMASSISDRTTALHENNKPIHLEIVANDALDLALKEESADEGLSKLVEQIGNSLQADRCYVFEEDEGGRSASNTYEWCAEGISPEIDTLQQLPKEAMDIFYHQFAHGKPLLIEDLEEWKHVSPLAYETLRRQGIHKLVAIELKRAGRHIGFIGVDNPSSDAFSSSAVILENIAKFVSSLLRNRDAVRELDNISAHDALTGAKNRRGLNRCLKGLPENTLVAIAYCDLNGLKMVNDLQGHRAGDEFIVSAAHAMGNVVGMDRVFRIGGDEFVVVARLSARAEVEGFLDTLRAEFDANGVSAAIGCAIDIAPIRDVDAFVAKADRRMYANKSLTRRKPQDD